MTKIILTCEHGGSKIPLKYKKYFLRNLDILQTHRALDIGALPIALNLKSLLNVSLDYCTISRLIVDANRFLNSPTLFSEFLNSCSRTEKEKIIKKYHQPHWRKVISKIKKNITLKNRTVHISVHSMTDQLNKQNRPMQLALLYDPSRTAEKKLVGLWIKELKLEFPLFLITRNKPYRGDGDGLTSHLRKIMPEKKYLGIELEMNQKMLKSLKTKKQRQNFSTRLGTSLERAVLKSQ